MLWLLAVPLSEINVLLSFYIKMMQGRRLQACRLRHSIKIGMLSVWGKLDLFKSGRGESSSPLLPLASCQLNGIKTFCDASKNSFSDISPNKCSHCITQLHQKGNDLNGLLYMVKLQKALTKFVL